MSLVGRALFGVDVKLPSDVDWSALYRESVSQAILPLIYCNLSEDEKSTIPKDVEQNWQTMFYRYTVQSQRLLYEQKNVLEYLAENDISFAVLKGSSCTLNYPDPSLRVMGDIDILVSPEKQKFVTELLQKNGYSEILDEKHHCHYTITKNNITVEVHKEPNGIFVNEDGGIKNKIDNFFANALNNVKSIDGIPMLDDKCQAMVLILHKLEHFISGGLGLRQLCDWAVFVNKKLDNKLWNELEPLLSEFGLLTFTLAVTRACVDNIGLPKEKAAFIEKCDKELSDKVIEHIIQSGNFGIKDSAYGERFFVDSHSKNRISSFFKVANSACKTHWPVCERYPILMIVAPFVVYARYIKLRIQGKRDKFKPIKLYKNAGSKQQLYRELKPFVTEDKKDD